MDARSGRLRPTLGRVRRRLGGRRGEQARQLAKLTKQLAVARAEAGRNARTVAGQATRIQRQAGRLERQAARLERQAAQIDRLNRTVQAMSERSKPVEQASRYRDIEHGQIALGLAALEQRTGRLEELVAQPPLTTDDASVAEARSLVDEVRREHEQVRVRMQIIAQHEERLRRVEAAIEAFDNSDVRRVV